MYPQRIRVPEKSSSLDSAILNRNLAAISRKFHEILPITLEVNSKEQILTLTSEIRLSFVGKILQHLVNQERNWPFWRKKFLSSSKNKAVKKNTRKSPIEIKSYTFQLQILYIFKPKLFRIILESVFFKLKTACFF
jgi:hypothetical protein